MIALFIHVLASPQHIFFLVKPNLGHTREWNIIIDHEVFALKRIAANRKFLYATTSGDFFATTCLRMREGCTDQRKGNKHQHGQQKPQTGSVNDVDISVFPYQTITRAIG